MKNNSTAYAIKSSISGNKNKTRAKIIHMPGIDKQKSRPLTPLMISTLLACCKNQENGVSFGPKDIKGSFGSLVTRGLIIRQEVSLHGCKELRWQISIEAIDILKSMGLYIPRKLNYTIHLKKAL